MNFKKEQAKKERFQKNMLPVLQSKAIQGRDNYRALLAQSAKEFTELLHDLENSGLNMRKIHDFNSAVAGLGDEKDLSPEEMLCALELLAKYIVMHANLLDGDKRNRWLVLLGFDPEKLARMA